MAVFDEQVVGYQPSAKTKNKAEQAGHPIPVVYIPRKPHPNGLLFYVVCNGMKSLTIQLIVFLIDCYNGGIPY